MFDKIIIMKKTGHYQKHKTCTYAIEILDWEPSYFRSVNINKHLIEGPFWENLDIKIEGKLIHPKKLAEKNIEVTMIGSRQLVRVLEEPEKYQGFDPSSVGTLTIRGKQRELFGSIPFDVMGSISSLLQSGKIKFIVLSGHALYHGKAEIKSIRFQRDFGPEDLM